MSNSEQRAAKPKDFTLGPLGTLNQVVKALGKTIRAMADDTITSEKGARICNGLGILRQCLETQKLEELGDRLNKLEGFDPVASRAISQMVTVSPLPPLIEAKDELNGSHKANSRAGGAAQAQIPSILAVAFAFGRTTAVHD